MELRKSPFNFYLRRMPSRGGGKTDAIEREALRMASDLHEVRADLAELIKAVEEDLFFTDTAHKKTKLRATLAKVRP